MWVRINSCSIKSSPFPTNAISQQAPLPTNMVIFCNGGNWYWTTCPLPSYPVCHMTMSHVTYHSYLLFVTPHENSYLSSGFCAFVVWATASLIAFDFVPFLCSLFFLTFVCLHFIKINCLHLPPNLDNPQFNKKGKGQNAITPALNISGFCYFAKI